VKIRTQSSRTWRFLTLGSLALTLSACTCLHKGQADLDVGLKQRGIASWYGSDFHGWATASGEIYNMEALTGAHRTLPLGTVVRVTNIVNGKQVRVRINDRGPYKNGRIADLSYGAAKAIGMVDHGLAAVQLEVVGHHESDDWSLSKLGVGLAQESPARVSKKANREVGEARAGLPHALSKEARRERGPRHPPGDMVPERRARRVTTILEADEGVSIVAALEWT
jgi:rare lipoprotein A